MAQEGGKKKEDSEDEDHGSKHGGLDWLHSQFLGWRDQNADPEAGYREIEQGEQSAESSKPEDGVGPGIHDLGKSDANF